MKRHERPFGCTFGCTMKAGDHKVFGSKNDWKRHEEGLHFQQPLPDEEWQCNEMVGTADTGGFIHCETLLSSSDEFQDHLTAAHSVTDKKLLRDKTAHYRAVPVGKLHYWCGFCKKNIHLADDAGSTIPFGNGGGGGSGEDDNDGDGNAAANSGAANDSDKRVNRHADHKPHRDGFMLFSDFLCERFNHIDNHFVGRAERQVSIAQWVPGGPSRPNIGVRGGGKSTTGSGRNQDEDDEMHRKRHRDEDWSFFSKRSKSGRKKTKFLWYCVCATAGSCLLSF